MYRVGIDIGSTTIKVVVLDDDDRIVFSQYAMQVVMSFMMLVIILWYFIHRYDLLEKVSFVIITSFFI